MEVNSKKYDVYPLFETMVDKSYYTSDAKQVIDKVFDGKSIPISRRVILYHYFDAVLKNLRLSTGGAPNATINFSE